MPNREYALVQSVKASGFDPTPNPIVIDAKARELRPGDQPMLPRREYGDPPIGGW